MVSNCPGRENAMPTLYLPADWAATEAWAALLVGGPAAGVQSQAPSLWWRTTEAIDQAVVDEGVRLTLVGIGTAFALLLLLTLMIVLMGGVARLISRRGAGGARDEAGPEARHKALAAVVGVSIMREGTGRSEAAGDTPG
jgi:Na+-transporting methylmalonyl-CoA/oxaloacetate decarboxylase gamma subunit